MLPYVFTGLGFALLCVFLKFRVSKGPCAQVTVIKASVSIGFMLTVFSAVYKCADKTALAVCLGLMFGMLGDIFLDQKFAHPESAKVYTFAGFIVFAVGHVFYIAFLIKNFYVQGKTLYVVVPVAAAILVAVLNVLSEKLMKLRYGEYKGITVFYSIILFSFVALSFSMALLGGFKNTVCVMIFTASVFFAVSDLILSGTYFGEGKSRPVDIITNHVTYYIAQYLIALSLCFA
ncbi:MAG: lysoplasmalogenase [Clostridiales bacterium]|nr:lysoplasmalogenase [Clostridiales bacterium]